MKLHMSKPEGLNLFTSYGDGFVAVNLEKHEKSLILLPDAIHPAWTEASVDTLCEADMQKLLQLGCEIILLGTGNTLRFPSRDHLRLFPTAGIGLEIMDSKAACRTYNILAAEGRKVAAAILLN